MGKVPHSMEKTSDLVDMQTNFRGFNDGIKNGLSGVAGEHQNSDAFA